jgi:hypothetical protein
MSDIFDQLKAEFPRDAISWRAQSVTKDGTKAMALAYIDARDVMQRLDDVVGPDGWQCRYPHATGKTVCEIGIRVRDEWIWKADGAGDTDIEAEKGALSDAFKRAAVRWGIGRYLYDLASPWVPCESYKRNDGKFAWSKWTADPWSFVRNSSSAPTTGRNAAGGQPRPPASSAPAAPLSKSDMIAKLETFDLISEMVAWANSDPVHTAYSRLSAGDKAGVDAAYKDAEARIMAAGEQEAA